MKEGAQRILEQALTDAVARPMAELQRKNRITTGATFLLAAAFAATGMALAQSVSRSGSLMEAKKILEQGYIPARTPAPMDSTVWPTRLDDGTTMYIMLPRFVTSEVSG